MSWNDERVELLKKLWIDGMSASQIASSLGEVTRNAVIGKIHRLGLSNRARPGQVGTPAAATAAVAAAPVAARQPAAARVAVQPAATAVSQPAASPAIAAAPVAAVSVAPAPVLQSRPRSKVQPPAEQPAAAGAQRPVRPASSIGNAALKVEPVYMADAEPVAVPAPSRSNVVVLDDQRVTIMMLTEQSCRWPIGDPGSEGFSFCGKRSETGIPYCGHHARIAYQPVERRRDRRPGH